MLLVLVRTASYAVPGGFPIVISHAGECGNQPRDEELIRCVRGANPKVMTELIAASKAAMAVMGCLAGCHINKDNSAGVLYTEHSQDSSFGASSGTTATTTGTGSLVGERLIGGAQNSSVGDAVLAVGCKSQFSSSWPSGLSGLASSERALYKGMTLDRASDEDYVPSLVVVNDVAMALGDDKTSEANGLGDSRHASANPSNPAADRDDLPSTVPYSVSATQDILGALAEFEAGILAPRPAELDSVADSTEDMDIVEQSAQVTGDEGLTDGQRITRLEQGVMSDRDLFDAMRDIVETLEIEVASLNKWRQAVTDNGCSRCANRPVQKTRDFRPAIPIQKQTTRMTNSSPPVVDKSRPTDAPVSPEVEQVQGSSPNAGPSNTGMKSRRNGPAPTRPTVDVAAAPPSPVTILRRPTYVSSDEQRATGSYASVSAAGASKDGYKIVSGRKRFTNKAKTKTPIPVVSIPVRRRHLTVRFQWEKDTKFVLPKDVTFGRIRDLLNKALFSLNSGSYFSVASLSKWGDVLLTLAATDVESIVGYYPALREGLESLGLTDFTFVRDTEKVKVFVGMVPLSRFGGGWQPAEWEGRTAFDHLAADIEQSNPGVVVAARPSWAGRLHKLKERKANNAGLILVLELMPEVKRMMAAASPRITVAGRPRVCRLWRENHPTVVCARCQTVGHRAS